MMRNQLVRGVTDRAGAAVGRSGPRVARWAAIAACAVGAITTVGCSSAPKREVRTEAELVALHTADQEASRQEFVEAISRLLERVAARPDEPLDILALSGGGDKGAFGAGVLVGWGQTPDLAQRRPMFDMVTGVSTGAMLAPFAFVGTDEKCALVEEFYRNPRKDWVRTRGPLFFLPSNPSFATIPGLERDVVEGLDAAFIDEIVAGSKDGRGIFVSSTNVEMGTQRVWELGHYARLAQQTNDPTHVSNLMIASSSIPAAFPPRELNGFLHTDGGVTANILLRLDPDLPDGFLQRWKQEYPDRPLPRVRYWIIVNDQLVQPPVTVQATWPAVFGPAIATSIRSATMAEARWLAAQARYVNAVWGTDIEVRLLSIPLDWRAPVEGTFKEESMRALTDIGRTLGADPNSWTVLVDDVP